ncbi:MAG: hypothetical protein KBC64_01440 [Simkaniaceae bacterium]|nr:hypothetical protein [Simkaniaceae bacterium]
MKFPQKPDDQREKKLKEHPLSTLEENAAKKKMIIYAALLEPRYQDEGFIWKPF